MIIIFVDFIDQLIDYPINCARLTIYPKYSDTLIFITLWANSANDKLLILFLFFPENRIWHFTQIVFIGDHLHEMSKPVFLKKKKI